MLLLRGGASSDMSLGTPSGHGSFTTPSEVGIAQVPLVHPIPPRSGYTQGSGSPTSPLGLPQGLNQSVDLGGDPEALPSSFKVVLDRLFQYFPEARGASSFSKDKVTAPFQSSKAEKDRSFTQLRPAAVLEDALRVTQEKVERDMKADKSPSLSSFTARKRKPFLVDGDPSAGIPLKVNLSLVAAHPACAKGKTQKDKVYWTVEDMVNLEQSAHGMRDLLNFVFWLTGAAVRHLQQSSPSDHSQQVVADGFLDLLAMAMSHLSAEMTSQMTFAIMRRRDHFLYLLPSTISAEETDIEGFGP